MTTRMTLLGVASALALVTLAAPAAAKPKGEKKAPAAKSAKPDCPPGAFCEETTVAPPEDATKDPEDAADESGEAPPDGEAKEAPEVVVKKGDDPTTVVLPPAPRGSDPNAPRTFTYHPDPDGGPGQIIIYEDGTTAPHLPGAQPAVPDALEKPRRKKKWRKHRRWGIQLRVDGVILPQYRDDVEHDTGMAGLGLSLRYRPTPMFALGLSSDFLGGIDANGLERQEVPIALSAILYANPRSVVQFYLFGGVNWSFARVFADQVEPNLADGTEDDYTYFGGHAGLGLEFRVSQLVGLNLDGLAFVRTRTDTDGDGLYPEFYNPRTQEASNSSAAGMLRAGVTFWW